MHDTNVHLVMLSRSGDLESVKYLFIVMAPRSALTWSGSTC